MAQETAERPDATGSPVKLRNVYVRNTDDPQARRFLESWRQAGSSVTDVSIEQVVRLEGDVSDANVEKLLKLLVNPLYQTYSFQSELDPVNGPVVELGYQRAVIDPETPSVFDAAEVLGVEVLEWARLSTRYQLIGVSPEEAHAIVSEHLYNEVVHTMIEEEHPWDSLRPTGNPEPVHSIALQGLSDDELKKLSEEKSWYAPLSQMKALQAYERKIGRPLTDAEIEITVQSWSDHCYHTTWRSLKLLEKLQAATAKINHPAVVSVFKDNAGGMKFYDGQVILIKGETHNFPSSIATFGGVATKHGGVIRDAIGFGKGGYPIGGSTIMGTMDPRTPADQVPDGALHPLHIILESIRATAAYCNPMGIPMMRPYYAIHKGFPKCLALGHTLGIIPEKYALKDNPVPGDYLILFGGKTGRDGIHGATASSAEMTGETMAKEGSAVQIGTPITERKFMTAVPELRDADCIRWLTDLGAGGISCAAGEMGQECGVEVDIAKAPLKDESLAPWEILLSESQERMAAAIPPEKLEKALAILARYGIETVVLGKFTDSGRFTAYHGDILVADLENDFLWKGCPIDPIEIAEPVRNLQSIRITEPITTAEWRNAAMRIVAHPSCCDQSKAGTQFDSTVQGHTVVGPYAGINGRMPTDANILAPIFGKPYGVAFANAINTLYGEINPAQMARLMVFEAVSKLVATGVQLEDIALCDNFYTPKIRPEVAWELKAMVEAIAEVSVFLGIPFISGKDSSSGTFRNTTTGALTDVPYILDVAAMGKILDVEWIVTKQFKKPGSRIIVLGGFDPNKLGGSAYLDAYGERGDELPTVTPEYFVKCAARLTGIYDRDDDPILSASAIATGGIFLRVFEACMGSGFGADIYDRDLQQPGRRDGVVFGEHIGAFVLEVERDADPARLFTNLSYAEIGRVVEPPRISLDFGDDLLPVVLKTDDLVQEWEKTMGEVL